MRVFLTGASGWIGLTIAHNLIEAGHSVVGLVRSREKGHALASAGGTPLVGSLGDLHVLRAGAADADGIIHTAFGLDISKIEQLAAEDRTAIETFGEVFTGSARPIVVTSGFLHLTGEKATEDGRPAVMPVFPRASEQAAFALADRGLHANVVRNPRSVHGKGEVHGFVPMLVRLRPVALGVIPGQVAPEPQVAVSMPSVKLRSSTPRSPSLRVSTIRSDMDRPSRSRRQTTSWSPARAISSASAKPGRSARAPLARSS